MAKKMKMRRTRSGIVFVERVPLSQRIATNGFLPLTMSTLAASIVMLAAAMVLAVFKKGEAPVWIGWLPMGALLFSGLGTYISWCVRDNEEANKEHPWTIGFLPNGAVVVILVIMYVSGIVM